MKSVTCQQRKHKCEGSFYLESKYGFSFMNLHLVCTCPCHEDKRDWTELFEMAATDE